MRFTSKLILALLAFALAGAVRGAPSTAESRALAAAENSFQLGFWERAEKQFAAFAEKFPKSDLRFQAVLRQAQARCRQGHFTNAVELLTMKQREAGALADEFQFWIAEAQFENTNFSAAAEAYARLVKDFTNSTHFNEAAYDQALMRSKLGDWAAAENLLAQPGGAFARAAAAGPTNEFSVRGILLLGEAQLVLKNFAAAEESVRPLAAQKLPPELDWRRQFLLCRIQLAADQPGDALTGVTNLLALAKNSGQRDLLAETMVLQGEVFERLKKSDDAVAAYEANLADDLPVARRRQAVLKIVELLLTRNKTAAAVQELEKFLGQYGKDKAADTALLTAGELHLREYLANPAANTNDLVQAAARFDLIATNYPRSPVLGKALLNRAWCFSVDGRLAESQAAFQQAAARAALAEDQALARFKWADCQLQAGDVAGALTNYNFVVDHFGSWPAVRDDLFEPTLYQILRASLAVNDFSGATNALGKILAWYPASFLCERGLLLTGEKLNRAGNPAAARKLLAAAQQKFPKSEFAAQTGLAVARTFEQETNWLAAAAEYESWLASFPAAEGRAQAEFSRAWDFGQAGQMTNALNLFTNFVARYPTNDLAALAQNWTADFFMQQGDFKNAEANYQLLFQKWPAAPVTYEARLMAGRAALARQGYAEAEGYFTKLINDLACPPELVAQAFFEYGDATMRSESADTNRPFANFEDAIPIFKKIPQNFPTNDLVPLALGRVGDCYLQLAVQDAVFYTSATNAYQQVINSAQASASSRSKSEFGVGQALQKMAAQRTGADKAALLKAALDRYLNVALAANLRGTELADSFWLKKATLEAANVAEALGDWQQALNLYQRLQKLLPSLQESLAKKIARAQDRLAAKN